MCVSFQSVCVHAVDFLFCFAVCSCHFYASLVITVWTGFQMHSMMLCEKVSLSINWLSLSRRFILW